MAQADGLLKSRLTVPAGELSTVNFGGRVQYVSLKILSNTAQVAYSTKKSTITDVNDDETGLLDGTFGNTEVNIYRKSPIDNLYIYSSVEVVLLWEHDLL